MGIRGILAASMSAVLICVAGLGLVAFIQLAHLDQAGDSLRRVYLPGLVAAENMARTAEQLRVGQALLLLDVPQERLVVLRKRNEGFIGRIDADLAVLEAMPQDRYGQRVLGSIKQNWQAYIGCVPEFGRLESTLTLSAANSLFTGPMATAMLALRADLEDLVGHTVQAANRQAVAGQRAGTQARQIIACGILAALVVVVTKGVALHILLVRPILRLTASIRSMANGDLEAELPHAWRHDEIGAMGAALSVFRRAMAEERRLARQRTRRHGRVVPAGHAWR